MIESNKLQSLDTVMNDIFKNHLFPSKIGLDAYNKYRAYKRKYLLGKLGNKGLADFLGFFGYQTEFILVGKIPNENEPQDETKTEQAPETDPTSKDLQDQLKDLQSQLNKLKKSIK